MSLSDTTAQYTVLRLWAPLTSHKLIATDFHEIWYERFAIGDHPSPVILNPLHSALPDTSHNQNYIPLVTVVLTTTVTLYHYMLHHFQSVHSNTHRHLLLLSLHSNSHRHLLLLSVHSNSHRHLLLLSVHSNSHRHFQSTSVCHRALSRDRG
jgi:hypothetical protein